MHFFLKDRILQQTNEYLTQLISSNRNLENFDCLNALWCQHAFISSRSKVILINKHAIEPELSEDYSLPTVSPLTSSVRSSLKQQQLPNWNETKSNPFLISPADLS